ncbi:MAG: RHS repeat-associated core domain-containing protein, partial [Kiritimatiellia bacterium]|nr:RHS repeat-associated core domain-containing protein [Kiritimatiellia bacterium]
LPSEVPRVRCDYTYDSGSRWVRSERYTLDGTNWVLSASVRFLYADWLLLAEVDETNGFIRAYTWGSDLSGSMQGAGGVGGLLFVTISTNSTTETFSTAYDGNGNVTGLAGGSGWAAIYEYDPFGRLLRSTGDMAEANPFRFSTKFFDAETGLYYYGYRLYSPGMGRWINSDPLGERGGANLYGYLENSGPNEVDPFGEKSLSEMGSDIKNWASAHLTGRGGISHTFPPLKFMVYAPPPVWLEANLTVSGEAFNCLHPQTRETILAFKVSATVDGFVAVGVSLVHGNPGKGRERNERIPNPNNPGELIKRKKAPGTPRAGFRERTVYGDVTGTSGCQECPPEGWTGIDGALFLRGSAGVGWGYQFNIQKSITDSFTDITQGWSASGGTAWGLTGMSLEAGITVSGGVAGYIQ